MKIFVGFLFLLGGIVGASYFPKQSDFLIILLSVAIAFWGYILLCLHSQTIDWKFLFALVVVLRIALIPAFPNLSDDIYRFYWDGMLVNEGISPYRYLPRELLLEFPSFQELVIDKLNSPNYYSIYPPLNQIFYAIAYKLSDNLYQFCYCLKTIYLLIELCGLFFLFTYFQKQGKVHKALLYAGNPLVLIEGIGNLHIEVVMVSFLIIFIVLWLGNIRLWLQLLFYSLAVAVKMVPMLIAPFLFFRLSSSHKIKWLLILGVLILIFFSPLLWLFDIETFAQSIDLYFRKFEFNASIYYIFRYLGVLWSGYNQIGKIGPFLAIIVLIIIFYQAYTLSTNRNQIKVIKGMAIGWTIYLLFSTTVHPWYVIPILLLSIWGDMKYGILWSFLIFLTYINYSYSDYYENLWVVTLEYLTLAIFAAYELGVLPGLIRSKR